MATRILLISCTDQKGLVSTVTGCLHQRDLNIVSNWEFVESDKGRFFMRTEVAGTLDASDLLRELRERLPTGADVRIAEDRKKRILIFATKEPHCLGDLLVRCAFNELNAEILGVISNHNTLGEMVQRFGLPFHHVSHDGLTREAHEAALLDVVATYDADYLVLAKFMRILTPGFVSHFRNRMINIHHSFLPAFMGANPYRQAYERGVKLIGATGHFVNESLDEGPIIAQDVAVVGHQNSARQMAKAGRNVETIVLARALELVFNDRVFVSDNKTVIFD
ncbi:MAG: formyltetrahydrofolate deformylase [Verrucomicrobia bacterium]|nr:formyltetrahydrofolate deformylase [Verrucomicrobiota bacterium]